MLIFHGTLVAMQPPRRREQQGPLACGPGASSADGFLAETGGGPKPREARRLGWPNMICGAEIVAV